jgi:tetratricopeptide (TPR) repeat protein
MITCTPAALRGICLSFALLLSACVTTAPPQVKALAEAGNAEAQNSMGSYAQEAGKYEEARGWYEKAAAQNHDLALNSLGYLYDLGLGVPQDRRKGFEFYTRAANLGEPEAMWNIANMYGLGQLGPKDMHMACIWVFRANRFAAPGSRVEKPAQQGVARLRQMLSANDLQRCISESSNWSPTGKS